MKSLEKRFYSKIFYGSPDGCHYWIGAHYKNNYGIVRVSQKKTMLAHRVSFLIHNGSLPDNLFVCHHCDNPACVNPQHLFLGTSADNTRDMMNKNRKVAPCGERNRHAKLTENDVREILSITNRYGNATKIGALYGVTKPTINKIWRGEQWKSLNLF